MIYIVAYNSRISGVVLSLEQAREFVLAAIDSLDLLNTTRRKSTFAIHRCEIGNQGSIHLQTVYIEPDNEITEKVQFVTHRRDGCDFDAVMEQRELAALVLKNDPMAIDLMSDMLGAMEDRRVSQ